MPETPQTESTDHDETTEYADVESLTVKRDADGELLPVDEETPMFGTVRVLPMPYGEIEAKFGDAGDVADIDSDAIADLLDGHVVEPDLAEAAGGTVTGEWVRENLKPLAPRDLLMAILAASDVEADVMMDQGGGAEVQIDEGNRF